MGLGGISVWQLVIILIVFLVTLIVAAPLHRAAGEKGEKREQNASHPERDDSTGPH